MGKTTFAIKFFLLGVFIILVGSCNDPAEDDPEVLINIEEEFEISFREHLGERETGIEWILKSIKPQQCQNAKIYSNQLITGNTIMLGINEVALPDNETCINGIGFPANTHHFFPNNHLFSVKIVLQETVENIGELSIDDQSYSLRMNQQHGITIPYPTLRKIPKQVVWGIVSYRDMLPATVLDGFFKELSNITSVVELASGYYGHFKMDKGSLSLVDVEVPFPATQTFVYQLNGSTQELEAIINNYRQIGEADIKIKVWDAQGNHY